MDWLSGWLKSVILVILLATFVDLLLPNATMQRYVKTVISLFLLLTLMQPLLSLFSGPGELDKRLTAALFQSAGQGQGQPIESLPAIQQRAQALQRSREAEAHQVVRQQVADLMKRKLESTAGVKVRQIQVETAAGESGQAEIRSVSVTFAPQPVKPVGGSDGGGGRGDEASAGAMKPVQPIQPVQPVQPVQGLDIRIGKDEERSADAASLLKEGEAAERAPELLQKKTEIIRLLSQDWQLEESQIKLEVDSDALGR
ncbi:MULTISPECIES: stage III sporulation protein AF [Paenibacillus]|uniref:stage III sporulation protein AF n=1 Tax=Paenibacillus TaxID=44249 RepID=UPI0022B91649|nr:stage III sporulation protein AF [Paenibacillus caseinilyticus]MCZ8520647.1 stage III sporulation protein AF [Paenibacillus caseinilyticus]